MGIIPVRLESSRLPGKALKDICGLPMIIHVYERCKMASGLDETYVATDSLEVKKVVEKIGGKVILTNKDHKTGTDRIAEAGKSIDCDIIINIQGDEALLDPLHIELLIKEFPKTIDMCPVGLLVTPFSKFNSPSDIKVVVNKNKEVMYISRNDIPSNSRTDIEFMLKAYHIVPFKKEFLIKYANMERTELEKIEYNEYLRILENGFKIKTFQVKSESISVDTPADLDYVRSIMEKDSIFQGYKSKYIT